MKKLIYILLLGLMGCGTTYVLKQGRIIGTHWEPVEGKNTLFIDFYTELGLVSKRPIYRIESLAKDSVFYYYENK